MAELTGRFFIRQSGGDKSLAEGLGSAARRGGVVAAFGGGYFSVMKSGQKNFGAGLVVAWRRGVDFAGCKAGTARRRGVPFVRTRRRGLRSMSGHPAYALGNPPTLRRSSFPQRASRPAGGPIPKHAWGCAPRPPNAQAAAGYERCKHRPYGAADTLSRCLRRILFWILQGPN